VSGFTSNRIIRRLFTPLAMLGLTITTLTGVQLPFDVRAMLVAGNAWRLEEAQKTDALKERSMALHEGKAIFDRLKEEERQAFEVGMEENKELTKMTGGVVFFFFLLFFFLVFFSAYSLFFNLERRRKKRRGIGRVRGSVGASRAACGAYNFLSVVPCL
ncbi:hypothetical protein TcG_05178, partial [Trypanosoma cruzi]